MRQRLPLRIAAAGLAAAAVAVAAWYGFGRDTDATSAFLAQHWQRPLPAQGDPPAAYSALERSLDPAACGSCHVQQHEDWRRSLHSRAMGPGIEWQFHLMTQAQANRCMDCHAPLAEQKALVAQAFAWPQRPSSSAPDHVPETLAHDGLVCAACHVRAHQRYGPPPRSGGAAQGAPHGGFVAAAAFEDSRFCAACHQFPPDGPATAGKLHEDTYAQWQASRYAAEGQSCQSCHMPDRRHQWQGIHSKDMVLKALDVRLELEPGADGRWRAQASLRNVGAGHFFPTYMVPEVTATLMLVDADGREIRTLAQRVIGWRVGLDLDREIYDTRLPPGAALQFDAPLDVAADGSVVELRVDVAPREHYVRLFERSLARDGARLDAGTLNLLRRARDEAAATRYEALRLRAPLRRER
ncbi:multiheme c-type cytochrome [Solimonas flava]|uniref:multiheme c-type cytochrome n=1 Tax=Solimonas flava TaxID=415849 RepID=UPI00041FA00C|nr:hypothetical protein [Solimonas flava]